MGVIPLNDRVLIQPAVQPLSDLIAIPDDHYEPEQMGTIIALGSGMESRKAAIRSFAQTLVEQLDMDGDPRVEELILSRADAYQPAHVCAVGDMVCFHPKDGQEIVIDGDLYLIMREDDLLAIVEPVTA